MFTAFVASQDLQQCWLVELEIKLSRGRSLLQYILYLAIEYFNHHTSLEAPTSARPLYINRKDYITSTSFLRLRSVMLSTNPGSVSGSGSR